MTPAANAAWQRNRWGTAVSLPAQRGLPAIEAGHETGCESVSQLPLAAKPLSAARARAGLIFAGLRRGFWPLAHHSPYDPKGGDPSLGDGAMATESGSGRHHHPHRSQRATSRTAGPIRTRCSVWDGHETRGYDPLRGLGRLVGRQLSAHLGLGDGDSPTEFRRRDSAPLTT